LHAGNSSSNLDRNSVEVSASALQPAVQPKVDRERPDIVVELPVPLPPEPVVRVVSSEGPGLPLPPQPPPTVAKATQEFPPPPTKLEVPAPEQLQLTEATPVAPPPTIAEPDVSDPLQDWRRGDIPMMRNWHKILGYQAILAAAMFAGHANAEDEGKKNSDKPAAQDSKALKEQLDRIEAGVKAVDDVKKSVTGLKNEIKLLREANTGEFEAVNKRIAELEKRLQGVESRLNQATARTANFPPPNGMPQTGRVRLVNSFNRNATVFLNDVAYRLEPGRIAEVTLPPGTFNFWVAVDGFAMVQPPTTATLAAGGSRTYEIYSR
jgi:hypothetical protein